MQRAAEGCGLLVSESLSGRRRLRALKHVLSNSVCHSLVEALVFPPRQAVTDKATAASRAALVEVSWQSATRRAGGDETEETCGALLRIEGELAEWPQQVQRP